MGLIPEQPSLTSQSVVFLDTAPLIYLLEDHPQWAASVERFLDAVYTARATMITSVMTYIELTTKPLKDNNSRLAARYRDFLLRTDQLTLLPIDVRVADKAAEIRAEHGFKTPDAIQVATAITHGADCILTNDKKWNRLDEISVIQVKELADA